MSAYACNSHNKPVNTPGFIEVQRAFAAHIRNPELNPPPADVAPHRMRVYVGLIHRNIGRFLANGFPVAKSVLGEAQWRDLVQGFIHRHASETPYFMDIGQEFMAFLDSDPSLDVPDWLLELCHYEWVGRALGHSGREIPTSGIDPRGDLMTGQIVPSPLVRPLCYRYRVNDIGPERIPQGPPQEPAWLIVCRRLDDSVHMVRSNALTHRLLQILRSEEYGSDIPVSARTTEAALSDTPRPMTGNDALAALSAEFPHIDGQRLRREGARTLRRLRTAEVLLGVRLNPGL